MEHRVLRPKMCYLLWPIQIALTCKDAFCYLVICSLLKHIWITYYSFFLFLLILFLVELGLQLPGPGLELICCLGFL